MDWDGKEERRRVPHQCQTQILERLTKIEVETSLMRGLVKEIHTAIHGNGKDGLLVRHDRVEQTMKLMGWAVGVVYIAVIGMLIKRWMG